MHGTPTGTKARAVLLISLMLLSLAPTLAPVAADGRDASIVLTVTPSTLTVNPGESGEYTVRVYNTGSNPVTVQLSASEPALIPSGGAGERGPPTASNPKSEEVHTERRGGGTCERAAT
ncbi:MAG: hypothetical protein VXZ64_03930, partial [Candidatus Thermoplasmatota archaeon]|nr:hypothetical protein [Candidatus Thermoplasmatota archaeon]